MVTIAKKPEVTKRVLEPSPDPSLPYEERVGITRNQLARGVFDHAANAAYCIATFPHLGDELADLRADDVDDLLEEDGE